MKCSICTGDIIFQFKATVLFQYGVSYYRCEKCGAMQTEKPYWLDEAYQNAITITDIGLLRRNIDLSDKIIDLVGRAFDPKKKFLDYGGGYGVLVRLLRDRGLDFYRQDIYCANIFALNYDLADLDETGIKFELVTCFEVFEHVTNPFSLFEDLLSYAPNILISTSIIPGHQVTSPEDWWYIAPETGQHITFYSIKALQIIAEKYAMNLYSDGQSLHLFTKKILPRNPLNQEITFAERLRNKMIHILKRKTINQFGSLTANDLERAKMIAAGKKSLHGQ